MFRAVANSPAALHSMWGSFGALGGGRLSPLLGEQIAVAVANRNACAYCLAAHTALGRKAGASSEQMAAAQTGQSSDPATAAALGFALKVVEQRAQIADGDVQALRGPASTMSRSSRSSRMWRSTCSPITSMWRSTCRWTSRRWRCAERCAAGRHAPGRTQVSRSPSARSRSGWVYTLNPLSRANPIRHSPALRARSIASAVGADTAASTLAPARTALLTIS